MGNLEHDPTPSDLPEPMPWDELAHRLQAEKLALHEELESTRQQLRGAVEALRAIARTDGHAGVIAANALAELGEGDPLLDRLGGEAKLT